jgi:hypothetical protein
MPTLADLRERADTAPVVPPRNNNREVLVADARNRMRSTEFIERKLQAALVTRGHAESDPALIR